MEQDFYQNVTISQSKQSRGAKFEVLEYDTLGGSNNLYISEQLFFARESKMKLKQVKITLNENSISMEAGALHFMKGNISVESKMGGAGGFFKKMVTSALTQEAMFKPIYKGTGEIFLEPTFGHFITVELENDSIIVDKGLYYCSDSSLEVSAVIQKNISSALLGGEGWFQTKISGTGVCVLQIPVPFNEILKYELRDEKLQVDGNFALLRTEGIHFSVQASAKGLVGTMTSGEGLLQTFEGKGQVWVAPTQSIYNQLSSFSGLNGVTTAAHNMNNPVK